MPDELVIATADLGLSAASARVSISTCDVDGNRVEGRVGNHILVKSISESVGRDGTITIPLAPTASISPANVFYKVVVGNFSKIIEKASGSETLAAAASPISSAALGSTLELAGLGDVSSTAPTDGQALVWDNAAGEWEPGTAGAAAVAEHSADTTAVHGIADTSTLSTTTGTETLTNKTLADFSNLIEADDLHIEVRNATGSTITKGTPVYITGTHVASGLPEVAPANATSLATMPALGLVEADILTNTAGAIDRIGRLAGLDTSSYTVGALVYVSTTAGLLTATRPSAPAISQQVAKVVRSHPNQGVLDVFASDALIPATENAVGGVQLASLSATATGTETGTVVTPAGAAAVYRKITQTLNAQTGTTYTPVLADADKLVTLANAGAITVTLPSNATVAFPVGTRIDFFQANTGLATFVAGGGAALNSRGGLVASAGQYAMLTATKRTTNTWVLSGDRA